MGKWGTRFKNVLLAIRPKQCDPIYRQKLKVITKFDRVIRVLEMTKQEATDFYSLFMQIDADFSGDVDIWEFADYYELTLSLFIERLFKKLDNHDKEGLFFGEYLFSIWNLCTLTLKELICFIFVLYDESNTGLLPQDMMRKVVLEMYELDMRVDERVPSFLLKNVDLLYAHKASRGHAPYVTVEQFAKFCTKYPEFINPALSLQAEVRAQSLNEAFWVKAIALRHRMRIDMDPTSFALYLKDLSELGNEKGVLRPGGDSDSDLEESDEDDDDDDSDDSDGSDESKEDVTVVKFNKRDLRKRVVRSDPLWERTIRGGAGAGAGAEDDDDDDDDDDGSGDGSDGSDDDDGSDDGDGDGDGGGGGGGGGGDGGGGDGGGDGDSDGPATGRSGKNNKVVPFGVDPLDTSAGGDDGDGITSPSAVGPLFSPASLQSPGGLSLNPPGKRKLGRRKIAVPVDPKWERRSAKMR